MDNGEMNQKRKKVFIAKMFQLWHRFNSEFFLGLLPMPQFGICRTRRRAYGLVTYPYPKLSLHFELDPNSKEFAETILHEMVHIRQIYVDCKHEHDGCFVAFAERFKEAGYDINS